MNVHDKAQYRRRAGAFIAMDTAWSIGVAVFLLLMMTQTIVHQRTGEARLAQIRADARARETALLQLSSGKPLPPEFQAQAIDSPTPKGYLWVKVSPRGAKSVTASNSLTGLVPAGAFERRGAP